jgi:hypothetical protein
MVHIYKSNLSMYIIYGGMVSPLPIMLGNEPSNHVRVPLMTPHQT